MQASAPPELCLAVWTSGEVTDIGGGRKARGGNARRDPRSLHHGPVHDGSVHFTRHRVANRVAAQRVRRLVDEDHPMRDQPVIRGDVIVDEARMISRSL